MHMPILRKNPPTGTNYEMAAYKIVDRSVISRAVDATITALD